MKDARNEMSDKRQETIADIVAEMRIGDLCAEDTSASRPEFINDFLASFADRIEAAWKREVETTTDESSAVGNAATVREVAQEMLNTSMQEITAERINGWATRLAAACEQPVTDCNQLNNTAEMREALEKVRFYLPYFLQYVRLHDAQSGGYYEKKLEVVNAALSAHPRNCDVGTAEEQYRRFLKFCHGEICEKCPVHDARSCKFAWAQLPYEEGGAK